MEICGKKNLSAITFLTIICLLTINIQCYGQQQQKSSKNDGWNLVALRGHSGARDDWDFNLTSGTYSEKADLNRAVLNEFGPGFAVADWNDLKAIPNIDAWIAWMRLRNGQTFMVQVNGKFRYSGDRQYFVHFSTTGKPPAGFLVHDKISNKLFLGSWFGEKRNILVIKKGGRDYPAHHPAPVPPPPPGQGSPKPGPIVKAPYNYDFIKLTFNKFSETQNLEEVVRKQYAGKCRVADWNDLKSIPDIRAWISFRRLQPGQTFFVTRDGKFTRSGKRQYFVYYSPTGRLPQGFLAHDQIGNQLFLGSWNGEKRQILVKEYR